MATVVTATRATGEPALTQHALSSCPPLQPRGGAVCGGQQQQQQQGGGCARDRGRKRPLYPSHSSSSKLEKCRTQAQQRRMTQKGLMDELAGLLPFPREVTSQMDTKTVLRLAVCYLRVKGLMTEEGLSPSSSTSEPPSLPTSGGRWPAVAMESSYQPHMVATWNPARGWNGMETQLSDPLAAMRAGIFQDLMVEALHGFLMVVSCDGTILYLSDTVFTHTGLFQSEHIGKSVYTLIHEEDHSEVREALSSAEAATLSAGSAPCSFFCRLKSKKKNSHLKAPGYKLAYISGHCKVHQLEPYVACMVHIVSAPSILEVRLEGNAFTTRHNLNMKIIFFDERMHDILGYSKKDLLGQSLFSLHHHDDLAVTEKCSHSVREKGEAVTGYYRLLTKYGTYVWLQTRGTMVMDRRTGKPSQLLCMHFLVDKEKGDQSLKLRSLLSEHQPASNSTHSPFMDPIPVPRPDGKNVNPLSLTSEHTHSPHITLVSSKLATAATVSQHDDSWLTPSSLSPISITSPPSSAPSSHTPHEVIVGDTMVGVGLPNADRKPRSSPAHPHVKLPDQFPCSQSVRPSFPSSQATMLPFSSCPQSIPLGPVGIIPQFSSPPPSSPSLSATSSTRDPTSAVPTPFSTPVLSPYWPEETSPPSGPYSNPNSIASSNGVNNPRSIPGSSSTSPQPIPGQHTPVSTAIDPDPSSLEAILQDLLGEWSTEEEGGHAPQQPTAMMSSSLSPGQVAISVSPDSGCMELETCLASWAGSDPSPLSSLGNTPTPSPAGYFSSPTHSPLETPPTKHTLSPPVSVPLSLSTSSSSCLLPTVPQHHSMAMGSTAPFAYSQQPAHQRSVVYPTASSYTTATGNNSTGTLRGLLSESRGTTMQGTLIS